MFASRPQCQTGLCKNDKEEESILNIGKDTCDVCRAIMTALQKKLPPLKWAFRIGMLIIIVRFSFYTYNRIMVVATENDANIQPEVATTQLVVEIILLISIFIIICKAQGRRCCQDSPKYEKEEELLD